MARSEKRALSISAQIDKTLERELGKIRKEIAKTNSGIAKANKAIAKSFGNVTKAVGALVAGLVTLRGIEAFRNIAEQTDRVGKLAAAVGETTERVSELAFAFEASGGSADQLNAVLSSLLSSQRGALTSGGDALRAFEAFGISLKQLEDLKPTQLLEQLSEGYGKFKDTTEATLKLNTLFPEQWRNVLNLIRGGGDEFRKQLETARLAGATVTQEQAENAAAIQDSFQKLSVATDSVGRQLLEVFGPQLVAALEAFAQVLVSQKPLIEGVGRTILSLVQKTATTAFKVVAGAVLILEQLGAIDPPGSPEQIAAADQRARAAAKSFDDFANSLARSLEQPTKQQLVELDKLQAAAQKAREDLFQLETPISLQLEMLVLEIERATKDLGIITFDDPGVQAAAEKVANAITEAGQGAAEQAGKRLGETYGAAAAASAAIQFAVELRDKLAAQSENVVERPFLNVDWDKIAKGWNDGLDTIRRQVEQFEQTVGGLLANGFIQATNALTSAFTSIIDGTKRAKDAWKDFGIATLRIIAQILARIAALKIAQTVLGLADGGVLPGVTEENASLPVKGYARGGVARSPQLAVFGEGSTAEAFVPLPDNRSIPVTINGGYGMGSQQVNLNVYAWDSKDAARGLYENRQVLQSIFTSQADNLVSMRQTIQRATR